MNYAYIVELSSKRFHKNIEVITDHPPEKEVLVEYLRVVRSRSKFPEMIDSFIKTLSNVEVLEYPFEFTRLVRMEGNILITIKKYHLLRRGNEIHNRDTA